jgi:Zn-dependent protease with chaperone function
MSKGKVMEDVVKLYRTSKETTYNFALCTIGVLIYCAFIYFLITAEESTLMGFLPLAFYILLFAMFFIASALLFRANALGNMILISEEQFPHLHQFIKEGAHRLGMDSPPEAFLYNSNGLINAFARQTFGKKYLLLTSSIVDAVTDEQIKFIIGHELGHHVAGHLNALGYWLRFPARIIPFLHKAYSRQCEYTCDKLGYYVSRDVENSCTAIQMLGCGCEKLNGKMSLFAFVKQENLVPSTTGFIAELLRSHPRLTRRVIAIQKARLFD